MLGCGVLAAAATLLGPRQAGSDPGERPLTGAGIDVHVSKGAKVDLFPTSQAGQYLSTDPVPQALANASWVFVKEHFGKYPLVEWQGKTLAEIGHQALRKRLRYIAWRVCKASHELTGKYPYQVDPVLAMALLFQESQFYEFSISRTGAAGIAQFMRPTAVAMGMKVLDSASIGRWERARSGLKRLVREYERSNPAVRTGKIATDSLSLIYTQAKETGSELGRLQATDPESSETPKLNERLAELNKDFAAISSCRALRPGYSTAFAAFMTEMIDRRRQRELEWIAYQKDLEAVIRHNGSDRDIFDDRVVADIKAKDSRFTYGAIASGIELLASNLTHSRINGNVLSALSAYNAGPSRTREPGVFKPFGRVPAITETTTYVSRVLNIRHMILNNLD